MKKMFVSLIFGVLALSASDVQGEPSASDAESVIASRDGFIKAKKWWSSGLAMTVGTAMYALTDAYGVPVSYEHSYVAEDRSTLEGVSVDYALIEGETLREALDKLCANSGGRFVWKRIRGILCVIPSAQNEKVESALDTTVTIHVDNVSTWDAILALGMAVNEREAADRMLRFYPQGNEYLNHPVAFRNDKTLSIHLDGVSARDALCAIMAASPFQMRYSYQNYFNPVRYPSSVPNASISLWFFENGMLYKRYSDRMREELVEMSTEVEMTLPPDRRRQRFREDN